MSFCIVAESARIKFKQKRLASYNFIYMCICLYIYVYIYVGLPNLAQSKSRHEEKQCKNIPKLNIPLLCMYACVLTAISN